MEVATASAAWREALVLVSTFTLAHSLTLGLVTVGVLAFVGSWNAYLLPLLLLQGNMKTLPLGVADFSSEHSADTAGVFA